MALTRANSLDTIYASLYNEIVDLLNGATDAGQPVSLTALSSDSFYALDVRNKASLGLGMRIRSHDDDELMIVLDSITRFNAGTLIVNNSTGRVGINTAGPTVDLEVVGSTYTSGAFRAYGIGSGGSNGFQVTATGQIGFLESGGSASINSSNYMAATKVMSGVSDIIYTSIGYVTTGGTVCGSGTATAAFATDRINDSAGKFNTIAASGGDIPANRNSLVGLVIRVDSGTNAGQHRIISAVNSDTQLIVNPVWGSTPDATTAYSIVDHGDPANMKINTYVRDNSVANVRSLEIHTEGSAVRGERSLWGIELGVAPGIATTDGTDKIVGIAAFCKPPAAGTGMTLPGSPVQGDTAYLAQGNDTDTGWNKYFKGINKAGTMQISLSSVSSDPVAFFKQNAQSQAGGIQAVASNSANYAGLYVAGNFAHVQPNISSTAGSILQVGGTTGSAAAVVDGIAGLTADIVDFKVSGSTKSLIRADGLGDFSVIGIATLSKAGVPSDADWGTAPPVGTLVVDTTNNRIYAKTAAATWKQVGIA